MRDYLQMMRVMLHRRRLITDSTVVFMINIPGRWRQRRSAQGTYCRLRTVNGQLQSYRGEWMTESIRGARRWYFGQAPTLSHKSSPRLRGRRREGEKEKRRRASDRRNWIVISSQSGIWTGLDETGSWLLTD